ncbi:ATP-dependent DNA helicase RecQ [Sedimentibacter hydroxybenzoicus DSM 7310]|uniref:DNA 3'-5' helicase n=1 Tax=Sedimentibacter hydroxybenzoicus DSM 7310 TaxID=1123245 RepID=A0A974BKG5_SEDHY|nr:DEAD/DEAH box helicase [Sedimentibacter hydroxybenzoicus]NYB74954.1 ATP-dependent DNA helicase RecQ [Sedimentibacter hydroxybenzoicus DSM 7310]
MNKDSITCLVSQYLNNEINSIQIDFESGTNSREEFYLKTVKRLTRAYELYLEKSVYKDDYLLALRDYLLTFDTAIKFKKDCFLDDNEYGIAFDEIDQKYFASFQLPSYVNEKFVNEAFIRTVSEQHVAPDSNLLTDPMIYAMTGYTHFKSLDQKLAVYGALNTPEGYTTLVSLPTGGGKSLVTQTISYQKDRLTIVIVPTVSLAIDQVRVTKQVIKRDDNDNEIFSYSSGMNAGPILKAIKDKKAKVLFISPEALLENPSFAEAIKEANKCRYLNNIIIDEAHIVVDWGATFRVDYQCLESWRNMLLMTNPSLRTILLSATFEDRCIETLKDFFEVNGKWIEVRCDALRHEPRYCVVRAKSNKEKEKDIVELVRKLPHPMIIYVARPIDADYIKTLLSNSGIKNVRTFTGLTGSAQRKKLIEEWVDDQYEIMVATSAFGVGVDKGDVRTVIHTYIPQNANTYYQELGRGGRDHLPCLSIMCLHPGDETIGKDRIKKRVLTTKKIWRRWDSLYNNTQSVRSSNNRVFIDTSIKPNYANDDIFDDSPISEADRNWNIYVLLFLRRYNLIRILEVKIENGHYFILIEIVNDRLRVIDDVLKVHIDKIREEEWDFYNSSYNMMVNAVRSKSKECISELFYKTYSKVYEYCAGCNIHDIPIIGDSHKFPLKNRVDEPLRVLSEEQLLPFGESNEMVVLVNDNERMNLLNRLVEKGVSMIVVPEGMQNSENILDINSKRNILVVVVKDVYMLLKAHGYYFTSGLVAVVYPDDERIIGQQYITIKNNLCGKSATKIIHIIKNNAYVNEAGKTFVELVDGPSVLPSVIYT